MQRGKFGCTLPLIAPNSIHPIVRTIVLSATLACSSCDRPAAKTQTEKPKPSADAQPSSSTKGDNRKKPDSSADYAVWYDVPIDSLTKRRAAKGELTASHNHLRLGTLVRVTHLANGKTVTVRITDHGITKRGATIDLCKEAAEQLEMISEGMARVRVEELPEDKRTDAAPDSKATAAHP